ncbi:MAG: hypothetical protein ACFB0B_03355 [Thermonemataceae bacterium]
MKLIFAGINTHLIDYTEVLKAKLNIPLVQWVDGSFISKKEYPNDIDVVTFIPYKTYELESHFLSKLRKTYEKKAIDNYFVAVYPETHQKHSVFMMNRKEWLFLFSGTRRDLYTGLRYTKGFLELSLTL